MIVEGTYIWAKLPLSLKIKDLGAFVKFRLTMLVLISAVCGYFIATPSIDFIKLFFLILGGFLVTGSSNGFNQVIEFEHDRKMKRTADRPIPAERMSIKEGLIIASLMGVLGVFILWKFLNPLSGILGFLALFMYVVFYTPLKRIHPISVFVGAIPGAIPPMLGYIAHSGKFGLEPGILFAVQFFWQFPHFWAIAWKAFDEYSKAGYFMLPTRKKDRGSAFQILLYSLFLIPASLLTWVFGMVGFGAAICIGVLGALFFIKAYQFYLSRSEKDATVLMFASFFYLPLMQLVMVFDKLI